MKNIPLSSITVTKAYENLKAEGYLYSIQGKGYFIKNAWKIEKPLGKVSSFTEEVLKQNMIPSSQVLACKRIASTKDISKFLNITEGDQLTYVARIRTANGEPMSIDYAYINDKYCPGISDIDFSEKSIFQILRNKYHLALKKATQTIESINLSHEEAKMLNTPINQSAFLSTGVVYLDSKTPIEYSKQIFRGDRYRFVLKKEEDMNAWFFKEE